MKIVSKQEMFNRIKERFPNQPFELSQYMGVTKPVTVRCVRASKEAAQIDFEIIKGEENDRNKE